MQTVGILLVPGLFESEDSSMCGLKDLGQYLEDRYKAVVVACDYNGDLDAAIHQLPPSRPWLAIGHSFGGGALAARRDRWDSAVYLDPVPPNALTRWGYRLRKTGFTLSTSEAEGPLKAACFWRGWQAPWPMCAPIYRSAYPFVNTVVNCGHCAFATQPMIQAWIEAEVRRLAA